MSKPYSFRFPETDAGRAAEKVLTYCTENFFDPENSEAPMELKHVAVEAFLLLGKQLGVTNKMPSASQSAEIDISQIDAIVSERINAMELTLNARFIDLTNRLDALVKSGEISAPVQREIKAALGIDADFMKNASTGFSMKKRKQP